MLRPYVVAWIAESVLKSRFFVAMLLIYESFVKVAVIDAWVFL